MRPEYRIRLSRPHAVLAIFWALLALFALPAAAQHSTTVTVSGITVGNNPGPGSVELPYGTVCATAVNTQGAPISVTESGWGLVPAGTQICGNVVSGSISGGISVPDTNQSYSAAPFCYDFTVTQTDASGDVLSTPVTIPNVCGVTGTTFALDTYAPPVTEAIPPQLIGGGSALPVSCTGTSLWLKTDEHQAYICGTDNTYHLLGISGPAGPPGSPGAASVNQIQPLIGNQLPSQRNLFDNTKMTANGCVSPTTGAVTSYTSVFFSTQAMPVQPGGSLTLGGTGLSNGTLLNDSSGACGYAYLDIAGAFVSGGSLTNTTSQTLTNPSNAAYFIATFNNYGGGTPASLMVVNGASLPSTYQSFGYDDPATAAGKTATAVAAALAAAAPKDVPVLAPSLLAQADRGIQPLRNLFDKTDWTVNNCINPSTGVAGGYWASGNPYEFAVTGYVPVIAGESITGSTTQNLTNNGGTNCGYAWYDATKTYISGARFSTNPQTLTAPTGAVYFRMTSNTYAEYQDSLMIVPGPSAPSSYIAFGAVDPATEAADIAAAVSNQHATDLSLFLPLQGKHLGLFGDSISSILPTPWQPIVTSLTGMTLNFQDARPGRGLGQIFECYNGNTQGGTLGTYNSAIDPTDCVVSGDVGSTNGNTLAQNLANVHVLAVEDGTNDVGGFVSNLGSAGDSPSTTTYSGLMAWILQTLINAKHDMRIVWIGPQDNAFSSHANTQALIAAQKAVCAFYGVPYLDMSAVGMESAFNASWYTIGDGTHPGTLGVTNFYAPAVAAFLNTPWSGGSNGGSGSATGVSSWSGDGALFSNSTSTGAVTGTLANAGAHKWWGNAAGTSGAPGYNSLTAADIPSSLNATTLASGSTAATQSTSDNSTDVATDAFVHSVVSALGGSYGVSSWSGDGAFFSNTSSTGGVTATLVNAGAHKWWGNSSGTSGTPGYYSLTAADIPSSLNATALATGSTAATQSTADSTTDIATDAFVHAAVSALGTVVNSWSGDGTFFTNASSVGGVTATLANAGAHKWWGNSAGTSGAPGYNSLTAADIPSSLNATALATGSTAATQSTADSSTDIATDAFVHAAVSALGTVVNSWSGDGTFFTNASSVGGVTAALANAGAHKWWGNSSGSSGAPGYNTLTAADIPSALSNTSSVNGTAIPSSGTLTQTIASGTAALGTSAIASGAQASTVTVTATGVASTDSISWSANGNTSSVTGYAPSASGALSICAVYPSTNAVNFIVCNNTASSITPGAVTLNWRVVR